MKKIISIILALVMCFFAVAALASCGESAYDIAVKNGFKGTEEEWLDSLKGDAGKDGENAVAPTIEISEDGYWIINGVKTDVKASGDAGDKGSEGADGREVEFRKGTTHIQWRYKGEADSAWKDLISIKELQGAAGSNGSNGTNGEDGKDGREVVFRTGETHIQWKYKNEADTEWKDLVAISTLKGADGKDSRDVQFKVGETHLQWKYADEPDTDWKNLVDVAALQGADGREVEFNVDAEKQLLQWRYKGDEAWTDLSELSIFNGADGESAYELAVKNGFVGTEAEWLDSLKGAKGDKGEQGEQGEAGKDGREVEVFVSNGQIRWRYVGEKGSYPLIDLWDLTGNGIEDVVITDSYVGDVKKQTITITYTKGGSDSFTVSDGNGVDYISTPVTNGLVDTYTIYYTNGTSSTFDVTNGNGIDRIEKTGTDVLVDTYTVYFTNGTSTTYTVTNGNGIDRIEKTGTNELVDTYTIYYTNGTFTTFEVVNGRQGVDGKSAYEVAVENGLVPTGMTEVEWVLSLKGADGTPGKDAREVEFRMNGPQLQWRYTTDENGNPYEENEGWQNLYNFGVELVQTNFVVWKGATAPTLQIKKDENTIIDVDPAVHITAGSVDFTQGGTYPITVTYNGKMSEYEITVTTYELSYNYFIWEGTEAQLKVKVTDPDGAITYEAIDSADINGTIDLATAGVYNNISVNYAGTTSPEQHINIDTCRIVGAATTWEGTAAKMQYTITYSDGAESTDSLDSFTTSDDLTTAGIKKIKTDWVDRLGESPEFEVAVTTYKLQDAVTTWMGVAPTSLDVTVTAPNLSTTTDTIPAADINGLVAIVTNGVYSLTTTYNGLTVENSPLYVSAYELVATDFYTWGEEILVSVYKNAPMGTFSRIENIEPNVVSLATGAASLTDAGTHTINVTVDGITSPDVEINVNTYETVIELADGTYVTPDTLIELWEGSAAPVIKIKNTEFDGDINYLDVTGERSIEGEYDLATAGTYDLKIYENGVIRDEFTIKVQTYEVKESAFWLAQAETDLVLVTTTPDGVPTETALAYTGTITWGTAGTYPIVAQVGGLAAETINVVIRPAGLYTSDLELLKTWDELGIEINPATPYTSDTYTTESASAYSVLMGDASAYKDMTGLVLQLPTTATVIGDHAFRGCANVAQFIIPDGTTSIGAAAFHSSGITSFTVPAAITAIPNNCFQQCVSLESVTFHENVTALNTLSFDGCSSLSEIYLPSATNVNIGNNSLRGTGIKTIRCKAWIKSGSQYPFGNTPITGVTIIVESGEVNGLASFTNTSTPSGKDNFKAAVTKLVIGEGVTGITEKAFEACTNLEELVILSKNVVYAYTDSVGGRHFKDCDKLTTVTINGNTGVRMFDGCGALTTVIWGEGVETIAFGTFSYCKSLESVTFPASVTSYANRVFVGCSGLKEVKFESWPSAFCTSSTNSMFLECAKDSIDVTILGNAPAGVTASNGLQYAAPYIKTFTIGSEVTAIPENALSNCGNIYEIHYNGTMSEWASLADGHDIHVKTVVCTDGNVHVTHLYKAIDVTSGGTTVTGAQCIDCGHTLNAPGLYTDDGTLLADWATLIADGFNVLGTSYATDDNLGTKLNNHATWKDGTILIIDKSVVTGSTVKIGKNAFYGNTTLKYVVLPEGVTHTDEGSFRNCTNLRSIVIPESLKYARLGKDSHNGNTRLIEVKLSNGTYGFTTGVFKGCTALTIFELTSNSRWNLGAGALKDTGINTLIVKGGLPGLRDKLTASNSPFTNSAGSMHLVIRSATVQNTTTFDSNMIAFNNAATIFNKITFGSEVTKIKANIFTGFTNVKEIVYEGTMAEWSQIIANSSADLGASDVLFGSDIGTTVVKCSDGTCDLTGSPVTP